MTHLKMADNDHKDDLYTAAAYQRTEDADQAEIDQEEADLLTN